MALILVEVTPVSIVPPTDTDDESKNPRLPCLSAPLVKLRLRQWSLGLVLGTADSQSGLGIQWEPSSDAESQSEFRRGNLYSAGGDASKIKWSFLARNRQIVPLLFIQTEDPMQPAAFPCWVVGYSRSPVTSNVVVSEGTLLRILPMENGIPVESQNSAPSAIFDASRFSSRPLTDALSGELNIANAFDITMEEEVFRNNDTETVESLKLRMALLLSQPVIVGTTADALMRHHRQKQHTVQMQQFLQAYSDKQSKSQQNLAPTQNSTHRPASTISSLLWEGALIVHSPVHGSGKTLLVKAIARRLKCTAIHVIHPGPMLAKYGVHADAGLESVLHGITMSAAARGGKDASICIILDHLDAFLPPTLSGSSGAGDATVPALNAIASYLKGLSISLKRRKEFPFPTKNPVYNLGGFKGDTMTVRICIVGIVTCPDEGWRSARRNSSETGNKETTVLDALAGGRFRLPNLSTKTRLNAFRKAFEEKRIELSMEAMGRLPLLAASAVSARGNMFQKVALRLKQIVEERDKLGTDNAEASVKDLEFVIAMAQKGLATSSISTEVSFLPASTGSSEVEASKNSSEEADLFGTVGGNMEAKRALEDALALEPERRRQMAKLGFSAPTGVLLYGPPGNGKTKLAKAVAELLKSQGSNMLGGAFISLRASDIVRAEVGNGEKALVRAFETARSNAPSVIFIDEFQALFTQRSSAGSGRLTSTLLQCMDDVSSWRDADETASWDETDEKAQSRVVVMGATNTPWMVDKAFLRPGRFDQVVHVGLPDLSERMSILMVYVQNMRLRNGENRTRIESLCRNVAKKCDRFSGADLVALCRAAAIRCLAEQGEGGAVEEKHFLDALKYDVTYSSSNELVLRLSRWHP